MARCAGIKPDGGRCRADAMPDAEWCWSHHPDYEQERRRRASKGGKRGGRGRPGSDLTDLKQDIRRVIDDVLGGAVLPGPGAVAIQGYNTLLRAVRLELDIREQAEILERLEQLEERLEHQRGERRYGL